MILNCIAIDDEPLALDIISAYCDKIPFINLLRTFNNAEELLEFLENRQVDLLFLDVQMDGITGLELMKSIKNKPDIVLTTAYDNHTVSGFEAGVTDFLLKPISFDKFTKCVTMIYERKMAK
jgi:two-component system, LytTR family, response regulator